MDISSTKKVPSEKDASSACDAQRVGAPFRIVHKCGDWARIYPASNFTPSRGTLSRLLCDPEAPSPFPHKRPRIMGTSHAFFPRAFRATTSSESTKAIDQPHPSRHRLARLWQWGQALVRRVQACRTTSHQENPALHCPSPRSCQSTDMYMSTPTESSAGSDNEDVVDGGPMVVYKVVNLKILRKESMLVGGRRVPFSAMHIAMHRVVRRKGAVLDAVDEEVDGMMVAVDRHDCRRTVPPPCVRILLN
ncbi:Aste57867_10797 [Aphanomyces stellatus]|uniref:Aste57867_10797 protein n=1 Tax=Aphanomyces stellatus TaxID=120398 RepID=A0A485KRF0_9STRA|nr:hypothetical protein As57867_010757 [Aphanomyces stellatus]VFT87666.1 Aste57867_10797 [Aphanomyces stellatus]